MITYVIDYYNYTKFNNKFCDQIDFKINIKRIKILSDLSRKCRKDCHQELYDIWFVNVKDENNILFLTELNPYYIVFEHNPEMTLMRLLVNFGGLIGLWHGLSIKDLKIFIIRFVNKMFIKQHTMRKFSKIFKIIKIKQFF